MTKHSAEAPGEGVTAVSPLVTRVSFGELVGRSPAMRALFHEGARLAQLSTPVLLTGEPGTGKDLLARSLHAESPRRAGPLVVLDCSATAPSALEGELFGRAEGATRGRAGALELAAGGSLMLDEVADLPLTVQARLASVLSTRSFAREAGHPRLALDIRLISASRRKLGPELERGRLQPALHAQLAGAELALPPLRERREDIPLLAQTLLARMPEGAGNSLSQEALHMLALHDWPGNVRELRNLVERFAYALRRGDSAARRLGSLWLLGEPASFSPDRRAGSPAESATFEPGVSYREERARFEADFEQRYVAWLLERHDGNISAAARAADMDRKYLYKLAKKHGLKSSE
ncbi:MAG: Type fimbriae expression regulatory protein PilR [Myxococcaceae bacterium]|nr:Type fimbriae expression regulatory protein PilR [Myxococcaceae bacterium]